MRPANSTFAGVGTTIFEVMSRLAEQHGAVNLGQGFPDEGFPDDVVARAAEVTLTGWNQYPSTMGVPELRRAVADHDRRFYDLDLDWSTEVLVTSGATEALASSILGLVEPGDEVVLFQPLYDSYAPIVERGGGVARFVDLHPPDWTFDREALEAAFSPRTKVVLLNDPLNPAAKVFGTEELAVLAELVIDHDAVVICDEVYEHLAFDGRSHVPLVTLPGMRDRSVKIGSAGKTFSLTGWKVGYLSAAPDLLRPIARAHQFLTYTTAPNLQHAVAYGLGKDDAYFAGLTASMAGRRDVLVEGLADIGISSLPCAGTYFLNVGIEQFGWTDGDRAFCEWLVESAGVAAIPLSAFYAERPVDSVVRLCFCKRDATLHDALERLDKHLGG